MQFSSFQRFLLKWHFLIPAFLLLFHPTAYTQYENLKFDQYNENNGLSNNNVNCIIQDPEGFIWVGTDNGLNRFDGYNFKQYKNDINDSSSLIHDHILSFFISSDSTLFIGTQYGFCKYLNQTNNFQQYTKGYTDGYVRGFYEDDGGTIYAVNDQGRIYKIQGDHIITVKEYDFHNYVYMHDKDGNHWYGVQRGVNFVDDENDSLVRYEFVSPGTNENVDASVFSMLEDDDRVWIGTRGDGIFYIDKSTGELSALDVKLSFIKTIQKDNLGNLLIGDTEGLKIFNKKSGQLINYAPLVEKSDQQMLANSVDVIMKDRQGNLWLAVKFRGLNLVYLDKGFHYIDYESVDPFDKTKKTITAIAANTDNDLWVGSYTNGLERIDLRSKKSVFYPCNKNLNGLHCGTIYELYKDKSSSLWIGSYEGSLQKYIPGTDKIRTYYPGSRNGEILQTHDIRSICEDYEGNFWLLAHGSGLFKWNRRKDSISFFTYDPDDSTSLGNNWAFHLLCDSKGFIWVATPYGLSVTRDGKTFETFRHNPDDTTSLASDEVFTVFEDSNEQIWLGTRDGLCRYEEETNSFLNFTVDDGLIDNYICSLLEDGNGNLWVATKKGLSRFNPISGKVDNFDIGDGLQNNEFIENSCAITPSGYMVFGSVNRGSWFHPDSLIVNKQLPVVYITDFKLFNRSVPIEPGKEDAVLQKDIRHTKEIILNHKQKVISFSFVALNYIHPEKNRFAYKLENFDAEWIYPEKNHEVTYTNLTPGHYTFRVIASNNDGYWNEEGASLNIIVLPPFWMTWWFRAFLVLIILASILLIFFIRLRRIRVSNIMLEKTVEQRTRELQTKNEILAQRTEELNYSNNLLEQRQQQIITQSKELKVKNQQLNMNSDELQEQKNKLENTNSQLRELNAMKNKFFSIIGHDLKNPVNVIRGFVELILDSYDELDDERKINYLGHISKTIDKTSALLDNLLSWAQSQSDILKTNPENLNIHLLVKNSLSLYKEQAGKKEIQFKTELDDKHILAYADKNIVETVVRNLISNAIKFSPKGSNIIVGCTKTESGEGILVWVKDSGWGLSAEAIENLFRIDTNISTKGTDGETGTGLGLILCKEFVEQSNGKIWVESEVEKGSTFYFTLPEIQG